MSQRSGGHVTSLSPMSSHNGDWLGHPLTRRHQSQVYSQQAWFPLRRVIETSYTAVRRIYTSMNIDIL